MNRKLMVMNGTGTMPAQVQQLITDKSAAEARLEKAKKIDKQNEAFLSNKLSKQHIEEEKQWEEKLKAIEA